LEVCDGSPLEEAMEGSVRERSNEEVGILPLDFERELVGEEICLSYCSWTRIEFKSDLILNLELNAFAD